MSENINEGRHQVKRVYGEHKRIRINEKGAPVRETIIKYVGKNYVREQDLHNYLIRLEEDRDGHTKINKARWFKRNQKFFTTFEKNNEKYISLSKYGHRVLELLNADKEVPKEINESKYRNIPSLQEHIVTESHDLTYQPELENARNMTSSAAEFTRYLTRKAQESRPENFREVSEGSSMYNINASDQDALSSILKKVKGKLTSREQEFVDMFLQREE